MTARTSPSWPIEVGHEGKHSGKAQWESTRWSKRGMLGWMQEVIDVIIYEYFHLNFMRLLMVPWFQSRWDKPTDYKA